MKITIFKFPTFKGSWKLQLIANKYPVDSVRALTGSKGSLQEIKGSNWSFGIESTVTSRFKAIPLKIIPVVTLKSQLSSQPRTARKATIKKAVRGKRASKSRGFKAPESSL